MTIDNIFLILWFYFYLSDNQRFFFFILSLIFLFFFIFSWKRSFQCLSIVNYRLSIFLLADSRQKKWTFFLSFFNKCFSYKNRLLMGLHLIINTMPMKKSRFSTWVVKSFAGVMQTFLYLKTYFEIKTKSVYGKICQFSLTKI